jgi:hypothetical protein
MGIVATLSALVLGLLIASAKGSFDAQSAELTQMSAKVILLDRLLAHYGPETKETRDLLRSLVKRILNRMWSKGPGGSRFGAPSSGAEILLDKIQGLVPQDDRQRVLQAQAQSIVLDLGQTRWLQYAQADASISMPLLVVLVFWLTTIFISFAPRPVSIRSDDYRKGTAHWRRSPRTPRRSRPRHDDRTIDISPVETTPHDPSRYPSTYARSR